MNYLKSLLIACSLLMFGTAYSCGGINQQVYSGKIEYTLDSLNPLRCNVTITLDFDINELTANDSIWVDWGDYYVTTIHALSITQDTAASLAMSPTSIYTHVYGGTHTYATVPPAGYYTISFQNEYRINGVTNIAGGGGLNLPFYLMAMVSIDTTAGGYYSPMHFAPLAIGFVGLNSFTQNGLPQTDATGDSVAYGFTVPLETISNPVPEYLYPDQFCLQNGSSTDVFSIDAVTGDVSWSSACLQGIYCYGTMLNKYRNGQLISTITREQNIYVVATGTLGIAPVSDALNMEIYPNPANNQVTLGLSQVMPGTMLLIKNMLGQQVQKLQVNNLQTPVTLSGLGPGVYFMELHESGQTLIKQLVIAR
jgi:hypothetical protein